VRASVSLLLLFIVVSAAPLAQVRLADDGDRAAFRSWFVRAATCSTSGSRGNGNQII